MFLSLHTVPIGIMYCFNADKSWHPSDYLGNLITAPNVKFKYKTNFIVHEALEYVRQLTQDHTSITNNQNLNVCK